MCLRQSFVIKNNMALSLSAKIEALLFFKAEPFSVDKLSSLLSADASAIEDALSLLEKDLDQRGVVLMRKGNEVTLGTHPSVSQLLENLTREELKRDIGQAGTETLSIILYLGPAPRADIDYIRGVNSSFILRHLLIRGLVERTVNPTDHRSFLYQPSFDLLRHLGVKKVEELPEYEMIREEVRARAEARKKSEESSSDL